MTRPRSRTVILFSLSMIAAAAAGLVLSYILVREQRLEQWRAAETARLEAVVADVSRDLTYLSAMLRAFGAPLSASSPESAGYLSTDSIFFLYTRHMLSSQPGLLEVGLYDASGNRQLAIARRLSGEDKPSEFLPARFLPPSGTEIWGSLRRATPSAASSSGAARPSLALGTAFRRESGEPLYILMVAEPPTLAQLSAVPDIAVATADTATPQGTDTGAEQVSVSVATASPLGLPGQEPVQFAWLEEPPRLVRAEEDLDTLLGLGSYRVRLALGGLALLPFLALASFWLAQTTDRGRTLKRQLELERNFTRTLLDRLPLPVYYIGEDARYMGGNPAFERFIARPMHSIIGKQLVDFHPDHAQALELMEQDRALLAGADSAETVAVSFPVERDGAIQRHELLQYRARFRHPDDASAGVVGILLDITEQQRSEALRTALEERLRKIARQLPGMIFQYQEWSDGSATFPYASDAIHTIFQVSPEAAAKDATAVWQRVLREDRQNVRDSIRRSGEKLERWESAFRLLLPGADVRWVSAQASPERQADGSVLWHGYLRDVTEARTAENTAHHNSELLRAMFENLPDRIYYKDRQSRYLGGNRAWWERWGVRDVSEVRGKTDADFYPADLARDLMAGERSVMETGVPERRREAHRRPDGSIYYLESVKCAYFGPDGTIDGIVGISRDITEQVEAENHLVRVKEAAEEASRAKSEFLAMMSHEIRTPMNGVIGATSMLLDTPLDSEQQEFLRTIQVSGENLLVILNDILDYSKIEAGRLELEFVDFDLRTCVEDAVDLFAASAASKQIELLYTFDPTLPTQLRGDVTRLGQVLVNLLSNAVKFTEAGEVLLSVELAAESGSEDRRIVAFSVSDTGIGVPRDRRHRLFQPFSQADASNTRRYGGTGLGLAISRRLVELMGGSIGFESNGRDGSCFYFTASFDISRAAAVAVDRGEPSGALAGRSILLVDDNATHRRILCENLRRWGLRPQAFASGEELLAALPTIEVPDALILDQQMPEMDGLTLARRLRSESVYAGRPIVLLASADYDSAIIVTARVSKPVKPSLLKSHLERLLTPAKTRQRAGEEASRRAPEDVLTPAARILVAEDNLVNQRINQMMLKRLGFEPVIVEDGTAAVNACREQAFDIVLMDVQMPRMDGLEATRRIRALDELAKQPYIIALTAGAMDTDRHAALQSGMNDFLAKPLKIDQLKLTLEPLVEKLLAEAAVRAS